MADRVPVLADKFFPAMGPAGVGEYVVGLVNVGVSVVDCTILNSDASAQTPATFMSSPANTASHAGNIGGPIVHSLGAAPTAAFLYPRFSSVRVPNVIYITADNSAVYFQASAASAAVAGFAVRMIALR
jgi:hypothetical protein